MLKLQERKETVIAATVKVDYPQENECITSTDYAFRIDAGAATRVEISIDKKEWKICRSNGGYWWYDWSGYTSGKHQAVARIQPQNNGKKTTSPTAHFNVELA